MYGLKLSQTWLIDWLMTTVCSRGVGILADPWAAEGTNEGLPCPLWSAAPTLLTATAAAAADAAVPETNVRRERFRSVAMRCSLAHEPPPHHAPALAVVDGQNTSRTAKEIWSTSPHLWRRSRRPTTGQCKNG